MIGVLRLFHCAAHFNTDREAEQSGCCGVAEVAVALVIAIEALTTPAVLITDCLSPTSDFRLRLRSTGLM
jgi:hypothetical protein